MFVKAEGMSNDEMMDQFVEIYEKMGHPMIASSDISKFESNNHQGIKDRLIAKVLEKMERDERYRQLIYPE